MTSLPSRGRHSYKFESKESRKPWLNAQSHYLLLVCSYELFSLSLVGKHKRRTADLFFGDAVRHNWSRHSTQRSHPADLVLGSTAKSASRFRSISIRTEEMECICTNVILFPEMLAGGLNVRREESALARDR